MTPTLAHHTTSSLDGAASSAIAPPDDPSRTKSAGEHSAKGGISCGLAQHVLSATLLGVAPPAGAEQRVDLPADLGELPVGPFGKRG